MKFKKANYLPIFFKKKVWMYETRDDKIMSGFLTKSKLKNLGSVMETDRGELEIWINYPSYFTEEIKF